MKIYRSIGLNFVGNAWNGLLIVVTTPWYLSLLGMEGYGVVGFWQLLLYIFLVFDFGLGATLVREFATYQGAERPSQDYRQLLHTVERVCLPIAAILTVGLIGLAPWLADGWLRLVKLSSVEVRHAFAWMSLSIGGQLMNSVYLNGLAGVQRHGAMNLVQIAGYTLKYLGGGLVLQFSGDLGVFFAYQGICLVVLSLVARWVLTRIIDTKPQRDGNSDTVTLRELFKYSSSMFVTASLGMLLGNADRILLSKIVTAEDLGRYTLALTAAGFLQMVVFAFYRAYFPLFAELKASGDAVRLKSVYYSACQLVGMVVVPAALMGWVFAPELIFVWIGHSDPVTSELLRWLTAGVALAGLMWLPAAYQQASGWTSLHNRLMALALLVGAPLAFLMVKHAGVLGGTAIMVSHGLIEISMGLILMHRVYFPGETARWYAQVLFTPLMTSLPAVVLLGYSMPDELGRAGAALWVLATGGLVALSIGVGYRRFLFR